MGNERMYYGRIRLASGGHSIRVSVEAINSSAARKAIEAQYAGQIKHWSRQMSINN